MAIKLREITRRKLAERLRLKSSEAQTELVAFSVYSIAHAYANQNWTPLAIYDDDTMAGFIVYRPDPDIGQDWVIRLMIAAGQRRKGCSRAAMQHMGERLRWLPDSTASYSSCVPWPGLLPSGGCTAAWASRWPTGSSTTRC